MDLTPSLAPDLLIPANEDWTEVDDASVWFAAQAGIPQAVEEAARRNKIS